MADTMDDTLSQIGESQDFLERTLHLFDHYLQDPILELGAGSGNMTLQLLRAGHRVVATELHEGRRVSLLRAVRAAGFGEDRCVVENLDLSAVSQEACQKVTAHFGSFRTIFASNVLEHVEQDVECLRRLSRVVLPGGRVCLVVPAYPVLFSAFDRVLGHFRRHTRTSTRRLLEQAGYKVKLLRSFNAVGILGWALNFTLLGRTQMPAGQFKAFSHLSPVLRIEDRLKLPFGLSIVAVGEWDSPRQ